MKTNPCHLINGKKVILSVQQGGRIYKAVCKRRNYQRKQSVALLTDISIQAVCGVTGQSKATLGRHYSEAGQHGDCFSPATVALADLRGITPSSDPAQANTASKGYMWPVGRTIRHPVLLQIKLNLKEEAG